MAEKNKSDLKAIFKAGAVPTEAQFADLIDSQINTKETASLSATGSTQLVPASGFFNLIGTQPFIGLVTENSTTGSGMSMHAGLGSDILSQPLPNSPFIKTNGGFDIFMDNSNAHSNSQFRIFKDTALPGVSPGTELLKLNNDGGLRITGSLTSSGDINITGSITCSIISASGTIIADTFQSSTTTLSVNDSLDVTGNVTASGNISASSAVLTGNITASGAISASGNLVVGGESTFNDEVTIAKLEKLYFDGPSGLHIYSEGTATNENQIILAKTNNLRILNQAHGKDIIFGTENASGTAKTPLTLSGSGDAIFGGGVTVTNNVSASGNFTGVSASLNYVNAPSSTGSFGHISASGDITSRTGNFPSGLTANSLTLTGNGVNLADDAKIKSTNTATTFIELSTDDFWNINANGINVAKLSSAGLTVNEAGAASCDFRVEGDSDTHLIFADAGADKVAIGTSTVGTSLLTVDGDVTLTNITASGGISASNATFTGNLGVTGTTTFTGAQVGQKLTIKNLTGTSETLTAAESGKLCLFSDADGAVVTLPDSGDGSLIGVYYDFYVSVAATSNVHRINVADTTNEDIEGYLHVIDADNAAAQATVANRALNSDGFDAISMDGTTTGTVGTNFRITNIAADRWYVTGHLIATGTPSTPFVAS